MLASHYMLVKFLLSDYMHYLQYFHRKMFTVIYESSGNSSPNPKVIFVRKSFVHSSYLSSKLSSSGKLFIWNPLSGYNALPMFYQTASFISHYIQGVALLLFVCFAYPPKLQIWNAFHLAVSTISKSVFISETIHK